MVSRRTFRQLPGLGQSFIESLLKDEDPGNIGADSRQRRTQLTSLLELRSCFLPLADCRQIDPEIGAARRRKRVDCNRDVRAITRNASDWASRLRISSERPSAVAAGILPLRRVDPNPLPLPFTGGTGIGQWRPTTSFIGNPPAPPSGAPMAVHWMSSFDPFTLTSPTRFRAAPPPALTSERYRKDYDEVKKLGSFTSTDRSPEQTDIAYFYTDNFLAQWNRALRGIATNRLHRTGDSARLFALANLGTADAVITAWDSKKFYNVWRPVTAINEGDNDGNPNTVGDPTWRSLINNPNYPDYTSGANNVTGAMTRTLSLFFGKDRMTFEVTSLAPLAIQKTRTYHRFSDAAQDVVDARVYLGIHFRFADVVARAQGRRVAEWTFNHFLLPLDDDDRHDD